MSYIVHYGIKGMKKGVRRWTNDDGTLNEAGKTRYRSKVGTVVSKTAFAVKNPQERFINPGEYRVDSRSDGRTTKTTYLDKNLKPVFTASQSGNVVTNQAAHQQNVNRHNQIVGSKKVERAQTAAKTAVEKGKALTQSLIGRKKKKGKLASTLGAISGKKK